VFSKLWWQKKNLRVAPGAVTVPEGGRELTPPSPRQKKFSNFADMGAGPEAPAAALGQLRRFGGVGGLSAVIPKAGMLPLCGT
jgi:hypothetical protein